jgi:DNA repair exonuclease SbcCD nuclease subunit
MVKPVAVLISDVHYNINTLKLADAAMRMAISKANELNIPLIVAGDLHDTKANLRGECVNAMIETFKLCATTAYILVGNHDKINEKSEEHSLNFLGREDKSDKYYGYMPAVVIVDKPQFTDEISVKGISLQFIPYQHDPVQLKAYLTSMPSGSRLIMHQGLKDSNSGDYIQDKSAISKEDVADFRVISGHYHQRQDIKCGRPRPGAVGLWSYIGNPYTLNFGEANDPPKGFQVLMDDGSLEFVPTNLRKHIVVEYNKPDMSTMLTTHCQKLAKDDLVWVKVKGAKENLINVTKESVAKLINKEEFRLELIPLDTETKVLEQKNLTQSEILDQLIDSITNTTDETKVRLKQTWKNLV